MTTKVLIRNEQGPDIVTVYNTETGKMVALLPGQEIYDYVYSDKHLNISEADLIPEPQTNTEG